MLDYLMVAVGGAGGSVARYWVAQVAAARLGGAFPYGTLIVNLTGSLAIGFVLTLTAGRAPIAPAVRVLLTAGFLGGYTTFSAFEYETWRLLQVSGAVRAAGYVASSVIVGLGACALGALVGRTVALRP